MIDIKAPESGTGELAPLLSLTRVSKRFQTKRSDTPALSDVSFNVREGEFVCIVGPSGCGKSTLLNIIGGLRSADEGSVLFEGKPVTKPGPDRMVVFQEPALYPWLDVRANVEFGLKMKGMDKDARREYVNKYLDLVNLRQFEKSYIHELSGGMKQRVQLARALAVEPRVLLMDEPFAALDAQTRDILQLELQEIWARLGTTIIFITHNVREAVILGDRVLVMRHSPGGLKGEFRVDVPRPRQHESHEVADISGEIRKALEYDFNGHRPVGMEDVAQAG